MSPDSQTIPDDVLARAEDAAIAIGKTDGSLVEATLIIAQVILAERERIVACLKDEADLTPCSEDAMVTRSNARLIEADFSYEEADRLAEKEEA
jgi:hypothetical protein